MQYGHGTGEAEDSNGEANTTQELGTCPDCTVLPLRVGESFIADVNRFAQAALYATDSGASVIQEALGTLNSSLFAREAIEYAYHHGTTVIASAADEAAEHHNQPGALPDTIVVNSVSRYEPTFTSTPPSYLQLNGCTNFGTKVTLSVPSASCSSEATGKSAGVAGLIYSAALNAIAAGKLKASGDCRRVDGSPCAITPNEVRQLIASGDIGAATPADQGSGGQADDVNFAAQPEGSCAAARTPNCTDPNLNTAFSPNLEASVDLPAPHTTRYHARKGFDEFYGYGRLNAYKAVSAAADGTIPPQADLTSPDWFQQLDPGQAQIPVGGSVAVAFEQQANPAYSGAPLQPFHTVRKGPRDRTGHGFLASPVLAHLDGDPHGVLDVIAAGEDRHLYAWRPDPRSVGGSDVPGFPVLIADPDKITAVDPATNHLTFSTTRAQANPGIDEDQGKLVDTPGVADIDGSGKPSIILGSNEEYAVNTGDEGAINSGDLTAASLGVVGQTGVLGFANGRAYVIKPTGGSMSCTGGTCSSGAIKSGWPKKVGIIDRGLLPDVGEGIDGSPVVAPVRCPSGGASMKIGLTPDAGPAYIFNPDGKLLLRQGSLGSRQPARGRLLRRPRPV